MGRKERIVGGRNIVIDIKMARIKENQKGFKVIEMSTIEFFEVGGASICDSCNKLMLTGYYIAVLNRAYCKSDYNLWLYSAIRYDEDLPYELQKFKEMKQILNINNKKDMEDKNIKFNKEIATTAKTALEVFSGIIEQMIDDYKIYGLEGNAESFNNIINMNIKDMVIGSDSCTNELSSEQIKEFIDYFENLKK